MSFLIRLVGLAALIGGAAAATKGGRDGLLALVDLTRQVVTAYELSDIRDRLHHEAEYTGSLPGLRDPAELSAFIREVSSAGARDPSLDLWGNPYRIDDWRGGEWFVLYSTGPNGEADSCASEESGGGDDICTFLEVTRTRSPFRRIER